MTNQIQLNCPNCEHETRFQRRLQSAMGYACSECGYFVLDVAINETVDLDELDIKTRLKILQAAAKRWDRRVAMTGVILKDEAEGSWSFTHPDTQDEYFLSFPEDQTVTFWVFDREHCHYRAPTMTSIGFMGCTSAS